MVKLDIGVHVDGYIADTAITVDLSGHPELVKAAEDALGAAIKLIRAGINTGEVGAVIGKTINDLGYRPIMNLTGHGLERWNQHAPPAIPNKKFDRGAVLKEGAVVAIEPFATNGSGHVSERGIAEIYRLAESKSVRLPAARKVAGELERYRGLPFAKRWLRIERADFALRQLEQVGAVHSYPVLKEDGKGLISQAEHTVIVTKDGCEVVTL